MAFFNSRTKRTLKPPIPPSENVVEPFAIHCTTCKARLIVKDESVIGDILSCPKCQSMVQVAPPAGDASHGAARQAAGAKVAQNVAAPNVPASTAHTTPPPLTATPTSDGARAAAPPALPPRRTPPQTPLAIAAPPPAEASDHATPAIAAPHQASANRSGVLLAAGVGGGILLGALTWLALWLQTPSTVVAIAAPSAALPADEIGSAPQQPGSAPAAPENSVPESGVSNNDIALAEDAAPEPLASEPSTSEPTDPGPPAGSAPAAGEAPQTDAQSAAEAQPTLGAAAMHPESRMDLAQPPPGDSADANQDPNFPNEPGTSDPSSGRYPGHDDPPLPIDEIAPTGPALLAVQEIERRLGANLARVDFSGISLGHLAGFLSDVSGARVIIDEPSLAKVGKSRKTPVTVRLNNATPLAILQAAAEQAGLSYKIDVGRITLSARDH